jgi:NADH-quinone oxidoreductase subunit C
MEETTLPPEENGAAEEPVTTGSPFLDELLETVASVLPGGISSAYLGLDMPTLVVERDQVVALNRLLRDDPKLKFSLLSDLTAVDHLEREPRFEVVYHLYSFDRNAYLRVKVGVPGEQPELPTMTDVWVGANWPEREVFDMFGIIFTGHPELERILTPEGWQYFPLRRDFPLQGPGQVKLYDSVKDVF